MKTCPLCNQPIKANDSVVVIMAGFYRADDTDPSHYRIEATRQAVLSHMVCPVVEASK